MKQIKRKHILMVIGLILIFIPYFINQYTVYRLLSLLFGILLVEASILEKNDKAWRIVVLPIIFIVLSFNLDFGITHIFKRIPIYAQKHQSSDKVVVYDSLFYRVYSCDEKLIVDDFYEKGYLCSEEDIKDKDVSSFLNNVYENYNEYHNKFVKINGKISKVNGTYNLEMQAYTLTEDSINGYVMFSDNITLEVNFNEIKDLTKYKVYDSITVIGRVDEFIKKGFRQSLILQDSIILESDLYNTYELSVIEKDKCENDLVKYAETDEAKYFTSCLNNIFVKYDAENVYDLSYVLADEKIKKENLIARSNSHEEVNGNILYKLKQFNMLVCANEKAIILGNNYLELFSPYCKAETSNFEEEL